MKCPNCGRENPDIRLFCMQCGELLPEVEEIDAKKETAADNAFSRPKQETAGELKEKADEFDQTEASEKEDVALSTGNDDNVPQDDDTLFYQSRQRARGIIEEAWPEEENVIAPESPISIFDQAFDESETANNKNTDYYDIGGKRKPELSSKTSVTGRANTYIPKRDNRLEPDEFFSVRGQVLPEYDDEEEFKAEKRRKDRPEEFEDSYGQSFAVRHMRGIVSLLLLMLTAAIVIIWLNTSSAQYTLAKLDMAWKSSAYAQLADEAYAAKDLAAAGYYYTAALKRDELNTNYAIMAANSYIEGGYTTKALAALRTCIELEPDDADLYAALIQLHSDKFEISEADRELIKKGYEITGDNRLNIE